MGTYDGEDQFKNIITRQYLPGTLEAAQKLAAGTPAILAFTKQNSLAGNTGESRCWPRLRAETEPGPEDYEETFGL